VVHRPRAIIDASYEFGAAVDAAMDNNQAMDRRRTGQASQSPMATLEQWRALVLL